MPFPIVFQHDSMQCGIACLQMICKHFGREYSLDSLSKDTLTALKGEYYQLVKNQLELGN